MIITHINLYKYDPTRWPGGCDLYEIYFTTHEMFAYPFFSSCMEICFTMHTDVWDGQDLSALLDLIHVQFGEHSYMYDVDQISFMTGQSGPCA